MCSDSPFRSRAIAKIYSFNRHKTTQLKTEEKKAKRQNPLFNFSSRFFFFFFFSFSRLGGTIINFMVEQFYQNIVVFSESGGFSNRFELYLCFAGGVHAFDRKYISFFCCILFRRIGEYVAWLFFINILKRFHFFLFTIPLFSSAYNAKLLPWQFVAMFFAARYDDYANLSSQMFLYTFPKRQDSIESCCSLMMIIYGRQTYSNTDRIRSE